MSTLPTLANIETELDIDNFPTPEQLWEKYKKHKGITTSSAEKIASASQMLKEC